MNANITPDEPTGPKSTRKSSRLRTLILGGNPARTQWIQQHLGETTLARMPAEISSFKDGLEILEHKPAGLVILDIEDLAIDPLLCLKHIRQCAPEAAIVVISNMKDVTLASRTLRAGANAYLTAEEASQLLPAALEQVAAGERFVSEEVMQGILHGMVEAGSGENRLPIEMLSDREMVVFQLIGQGKTFREISDELGVNIKTVATHCNNIRRKLHSRDNRHLTRICRNWVADHNPVPDRGAEPVTSPR